MGQAQEIEECANCGRKIGRLKTPHLYDEHVVCAECHGRLVPQSEPEPAEVESGPAVVPYASVRAPQLPDNAPERAVTVTKPAFWKGAPGAMIVCIILIPLGVGLILMAMWWWRCFSESLTVTNKRLIQKRGIFLRRTSEVRLADIRNIQVEQGFLQQSFGTGTLAVSTAARNEHEIKLMGLPKVEWLKSVIDRLRAA